VVENVLICETKPTERQPALAIAVTDKTTNLRESILYLLGTFQNLVTIGVAVTHGNYKISA